MTGTAKESSTHVDIFKRLELRGIDKPQYFQIKSILTFDLPQSILFFQRAFRPHTPSQVLRQVSRWRKFLKGEFILAEDQKNELSKAIDGAEILAWKAIIEGAFSKLGQWSLSFEPVPTGIEDGRPIFIRPDGRLTAVHNSTGEKRSAVVAGCHPAGPEWCKAWHTALEEVGLLELAVSQSNSQRRLVSGHGLQAWPVFTQHAIPRLYEFLLPYYRERGHVWSEKEQCLTRDAYYPQDLLQDMVDILRMEQQDTYGRTNASQLKAVIQRYLARRGTLSQESQENPK